MIRTTPLVSLATARLRVARIDQAEQLLADIQRGLPHELLADVAAFKTLWLAGELGSNEERALLRFTEALCQVAGQRR